MNQIQMLKRQILRTMKKSHLPSTFQEVEYIESQLHCGIQLADSFATNTWSIKVEYTAQQNPIHTFPVQRVLSYGGVATKTNFSLWESWENSQYMFSTLGIEEYIGTYNTQAKHTIVAERDSSTTAKYYIDGILARSITGTFVAKEQGTPLVLFVSALATEKHQYCGKVYSFKLWQNNVLLYDLVPCYRKSDGEIGLYNLVDNHFFANDLSGSFLKGADV